MSKTAKMEKAGYYPPFLFLLVPVSLWSNVPSSPPRMLWTTHHSPSFHLLSKEISDTWQMSSAFLPHNTCPSGSTPSSRSVDPCEDTPSPPLFPITHDPDKVKNRQDKYFKIQIGLKLDTVPLDILNQDSSVVTVSPTYSAMWSASLLSSTSSCNTYSRHSQIFFFQQILS